MQPSIDLSKTAYDDPQMAIPSLQVQSAVTSRIPGYRERRRHHEDMVYNKRSFMNDKNTRQVETTSMSDNRQGTGHVPAAQQPMCSIMRKEYPDPPTTNTFKNA
jgi:hypothetical protein